MKLRLYIHLNPVRTGIVSDVSKYKWSSYHDYINLAKENNRLDSNAMLKEHGINKKESKKEFKKLIRSISGKENEFLEDLKLRRKLPRFRILFSRSDNNIRGISARQVHIVK